MKKSGTFSLAVLVLGALVSISSHAVTIINFSSPRLVGQVAPGVNDTIAGNVAYINSFVDRSHSINPSPFDVAGQTYIFFNSQGGKMTYANPNAEVASGSIGSDHLIPNVGGYEFLVMTYAGVAGESYIVNIAGLSGDLQVPATDPRWNVHSKYMLFNAVPDAGSSVILLGIGMAGIGLLHRRNGARQS